MNPYYKDYGEYLAEKFPGRKVQKISINAGFSCPNRDGTVGTGGCIYCDNSSFTPSYCFNVSSVKAQLEAGKVFFGRKYPEMKYLAYFQSFTNTFPASLIEKSLSSSRILADVERLEQLYLEALAVEDVEGLIIGSRPDCFPEDVVRLLERLNLNHPVIVEIGAETCHDTTLSLINRHHTWAQTVDAVERLSNAGISVGLHLICGLPGENERMILETVSRVSELPVEALKFHHLQIIKDTPLHRAYKSGDMKVDSFTVEEYLDLCEKIIGIVPRHIAIERFLASSPPDKVVSPRWGLKNYQFVNLLHNRLKAKTGL